MWGWSYTMGQKHMVTHKCTPLRNTLWTPTMSGCKSADRGCSRAESDYSTTERNRSRAESDCSRVESSHSTAVSKLNSVGTCHSGAGGVHFWATTQPSNMTNTYFGAAIADIVVTKGNSLGLWGSINSIKGVPLGLSHWLPINLQFHLKYQIRGSIQDLPLPWEIY